MFHILKQLSEQLISPHTFIRKRYATFQDLLFHDRQCHILLAELEEIYYNNTPVDISRFRELYCSFSQEVLKMISSLEKLAPGQYSNLFDYFKKIDFYTRFALAPPKIEHSPPYTLPINADYADDSQTGGKALHLSHLAHRLGLPVPDGFTISTSAWNRLIEENDLRSKIDRSLAAADINSLSSLKDVSATLINYIHQASIPKDVEESITSARDRLAAEFPGQAFAVRSSAVGEDSSLSFAGQYCSLLNIAKEDILNAYRLVLCSKYSPEAILYRIINGLADEETSMAVIVLVMVNARTSGVIVTPDLKYRKETTTLIHSVPGLGDNLMSGKKMPVTTAVTSRKKDVTITRRDSGGSEHHLSDKQLHLLSKWADQISSIYDAAQEIEWSCDNQENIYLLQSRRRYLPRTQPLSTEPDLSDLDLLFKGGQTACPGIGCGPAHHLLEENAMSDIPDGAILICEVTPPSLVTLLPRLSGVIARYGSVADHFASVAREFGIPVLVDTGNNWNMLQGGKPLTLWAERQSVYLGTAILPEGYRNGIRLVQDTPMHHTLKMAIDFISPLTLTDPAAKTFSPENCRSLHDIIRFAHEKAVQAMFIHSTDGLFRKPKGIRLKSDIPLQMHIIDVDDGLTAEAAGKEEILVSDLHCLPLQYLWKGLSNPGVRWHHRSHFDWQSYDNIALAGGIAAKTDSGLTSFCLISREYLNVNIRFGYHFTLLDCLCGNTPEENYILLRFAGGGGSSTGKNIRLLFISQVLKRLNFTCEQTGELLDCRLMRYGKEITANRLDHLGRLLGAVRLLDMVLTDEKELEKMVEDFFHGTYDFSKE